MLTANVVERIVPTSICSDVFTSHSDPANRTEMNHHQWTTRTIDGKIPQ